MSSSRHAYPFPAEKVIEIASQTNGNLPAHIADLTAKNAVLFPAGYCQTFADLLSNAKAQYSDDAMRGNQATHTEAFNNVVKEFTKLHLDVEFIAKHAFPGNMSLQREFGVGRISKIAKSNSNLVLFVRDLEKKIAEHRADLDKAGMSADLPQKISDLSKKLDSSRDEKLQSMSDRHSGTQTRINFINELWHQLREIEDMARIVYADNPAALALFTLPKHDAGGAAPEKPAVPPPATPDDKPAA